ncbi:flagellar motor protein [Pseudomaricurvus sp.]|uniref:flagellar motor protein n=1 Tax=Pseudomaricurvus sp. TaxID=2004510 RepID=UPI003F6D1DE7
MDILSLLGLLLGVIALIGGNFLEGGSLQALLNGPAALIVLGGTLAAAMLQFPWTQVRRAISIFPWVFYPPQTPYQEGLKSLVGWAETSRKLGLLGLERFTDKESDRFTRKGLQLLVDGQEREAIRRTLETDMLLNEQRDLDAARFFEAMGGYAPTVGIIGAVMGLIHVMTNLADPEQLGSGIAIAFVATIYGVTFANLFLLPVANKIKNCVYNQSQYQELITEGIVAIAEGEHPRSIRVKLESYLPQE